MSAPVFRHTHRVTYTDCTVGNHVYHSRYLDMLEAARGEFFRQLGATFLQWQERNTVFPLIECRVRYKLPARYDDLLSIELWPTAAERFRLNFQYRVMNQAEKPVLQAETFHVCAGLNDKAKRLPQELVDKLKPYFRGTAPAGAGAKGIGQ